MTEFTQVPFLLEDHARLTYISSHKFNNKNRVQIFHHVIMQYRQDKIRIIIAEISTKLQCDTLENAQTLKIC